MIDVRHAGQRAPAAPARGQGRLVLITGTGAAFAPDGAVWVDSELITTPQTAPARPYRSVSAAELPLAATRRR